MAGRMEYMTGFIVMASFWALNFSVLKIALGYDSPFPILFYRVLFAVLSTFIIFARKIKFPKDLRTNLILFISASLNVSIFMGFWAVGEQTEPAALSSILVYTYPIIAMIFSWYFISERPSLSKLIAAFIGFSGVVMIFIEQVHISSVFGVIFLLISAISWALGTNVYKKYLSAEKPETVNSIQLLYSLPVMLICALVADPSGTLFPGYQTILLTIYMGVPATTIAYLIFFYLFRKYTVNEISSYFFAVPALSILFSLIILKEQSTLSTYIGFALISIGIFLSYWNTKNSTQMTANPE